MSRPIACERERKISSAIVHDKFGTNLRFPGRFWEDGWGVGGGEGWLVRGGGEG